MWSCANSTVRAGLLPVLNDRTKPLPPPSSPAATVVTGCPPSSPLLDLCGLTVWFQQEQACSTDFLTHLHALPLPLAGGGTAVVYEAVDRQACRSVALKVGPGRTAAAAPRTERRALPTAPSLCCAHLPSPSLAGRSPPCAGDGPEGQHGGGQGGGAGAAVRRAAAPPPHRPTTRLLLPGPGRRPAAGDRGERAGRLPATCTTRRRLGCCASAAQRCLQHTGRSPGVLRLGSSLTHPLACLCSGSWWMEWTCWIS